jgi:hypothetical protein
LLSRCSTTSVTPQTFLSLVIFHVSSHGFAQGLPQTMKLPDN